MVLRDRIIRELGIHLALQHSRTLATMAIVSLTGYHLTSPNTVFLVFNVSAATLGDLGPWLIIGFSATLRILTPRLMYYDRCRNSHFSQEV